MNINIFKSKSPILSSILMGAVLGTVLYGLSLAQPVEADLKNSATTISPATLIKNGRLTICKLDRSKYEVVRTMKRIEITFYTSTPDQTDATPLITASGKKVYDGVIATNMLPFGTKVRIPILFGEKIFTVEDRMHERFSERVDVWLPGGEEGKKEAFRLGKQRTNIEIVES